MYWLWRQGRSVLRRWSPLSSLRGRRGGVWDSETYNRQVRAHVPNPSSYSRLASVEPPTKRIFDGNHGLVETGENHEKIMFKSSEKISTKMHYFGKTKFYRLANLQFETQKCLGAMKMTNSTMDSSKMNSRCKRTIHRRIFSFL